MEQNSIFHPFNHISSDVRFLISSVFHYDRAADYIGPVSIAVDFPLLSLSFVRRDNVHYIGTETHLHIT